MQKVVRGRRRFEKRRGTQFLSTRAEHVQPLRFCRVMAVEFAVARKGGFQCRSRPVQWLRQHLPRKNSGQKRDELQLSRAAEYLLVVSPPSALKKRPHPLSLATGRYCA